MKHVCLPDGTLTSQIGLGCASFFVGPGQDAVNRLVWTALDVGIRHFDTAPAYGSGTSEDALAAALKGFSERVTITTKVGLARPPATQLSYGLKLRRLARTAFSFTPKLKARLAQKAYQVSRRTNFDVAFVEDSFIDSLRRLKRERIDVLLLHEPEPQDVTDELLRWIESKVDRGQAGVVGFGAKRENIAQLLDLWPDAQFLQTNWSLQKTRIPNARFASLHGVLRGLSDIRECLSHDATLRERLNRCSFDQGSKEGLASALIELATRENPDSLVLVASSNPERVSEAAKAASNGR